MAKNKNREYWNRRYLMDKARIINDVEDFLKTNQLDLYTKAGKEIQEKIKAFYSRYAKNNGVSLADARRMIGRAEAVGIDWAEFTSWQPADGLPGDVVALMEKNHMDYEQLVDALSKKGSISRLQILQAEIDRTVLDLYDSNQHSIYDYLAAEYESTYYKQVYNAQQGIGYGKNFAALNRRAVDTAILHQYTRGNFSEALYGHCRKLSADIRECLAVGMITGENLDRLARRVQKRLDVSFSNARRLVRTETAYTYEQATKKAYQECGIDKYEFLAALDKRTSKPCRQLDGKVFSLQDAMPGKNYPPMHPNCRSTTVCVFDDDKITTRLAKDAGGKYYEVPSDMIYSKWQKKYVTHITTAEQKAVNDYIGFKSYIINEKLRNGTKLDTQEKMLLRKLDSALEKMPVYKGNLVRDLQFRDTGQREQFLALHKIGSIVEYDAYTSTSKQEGYSADFDVKIYIQSACEGRDISSFNREENEVLYKRNSRFRVQNVEWQQDKVFLLMEEYDEKEGRK